MERWTGPTCGGVGRLRVRGERPLERRPREDHVPDERLDRSFPHETHKKELLDDGRGHRSQRGKAQQ